MPTFSITRFIATFALCVAASAGAVYLCACPFCSALNLTFAEQIKTNDIVVIAKLLEIPEPVDDPDAALPKSVFEITDVIKGDDIVRAGMQIRSLLIGRYPIGNEFLVMGVDPPNVAWSTPMKASERVVKYLKTIQTLPKSGKQRLTFFMDYFEDKESVLAFDAYDEFAQAAYEDIVEIKDEMDRAQLIKWIRNPETSINRRRLYLTLLGVCGEASDALMLEEFIKSGDRKQQGGLDALIACYLTLKGEAGLELIVDTFLKDENVEYVDTLGAVSALRFHANDVEVISKPKVVDAVRTLLDRPKIADMIIPDLARWEDWSVMERLVQMFKDANEDTSWLRVPIASYLRACPRPEAEKYIAELQKIDPDSIKRADFFLNFDDEDEIEDGDSDATETDAKVDKNDQTDGASKDHAPADDAPKDGDPADGGQQPVSNEDSADLITETWVTRRVPLDDVTVSIPKLPGTAIPANSMDKLPVSKTKPVTVQRSELVSETVALQAQPALIPVASSNVKYVPIWQLVLIPMAFSIGIFLLLWSVISGWFDRLIF